MQTNEGAIDRIARIMAGFMILMLLPVTMWGFLGLIPLLSGLLGFCPVYAVAGISTCGKPSLP